MGREKLPIPVYNSVDDSFPEMINYISYSRPSDPSFTVKKEINDSTCCTCRDNCRNCECVLREVPHISRVFEKLMQECHQETCFCLMLLRNEFHKRLLSGILMYIYVNVRWRNF